MKIKLDENLPEALVPALAALGHEVDNVRLEGLAGKDDATVWQAAQTEGRFLVTQDLDFSDVRQFTPGTHHGLLLVRMRTAGRKALTDLVTKAFSEDEATSWQRCYVVLTERKLRVHRPAS
jgi:predicted nuclease of predicted toxin-antitoxin system